MLVHTVYPKKYAHSFVVLCFVVVIQSFIMNSHEVFIHIHQGCFAGTGAIVRLPQCQWSKPDGYGKISQCITITKHSKAKTVCIFLGIYCKVLESCTEIVYNVVINTSGAMILSSLNLSRKTVHFPGAFTIWSHWLIRLPISKNRLVNCFQGSHSQGIYRNVREFRNNPPSPWKSGNSIHFVKKSEKSANSVSYRQHQNVFSSPSQVTSQCCAVVSLL